MVMMKQLLEKAKSAQALRRLTAGALSLALLMLHPAPAKALYHCRVSGETFSECCCEGAASCCDERAASQKSCCSDSSQPSDSAIPNSSTVLAPASCGCCDISFESGTQIPPAVSGSASETSSKKSHSVVAVAVAPFTLKWTDASLRLPVPRRYLIPVEGPPLYILHASLLN